MSDQKTCRNCEKSVTDTLWPDDDSCIAGGRTQKFWSYKGAIVMEVRNN